MRRQNRCHGLGSSSCQTSGTRLFSATIRQISAMYAEESKDSITALAPKYARLSIPNPGDYSLGS